ncbi:serine/threonine-protein kinase, putative [Leishmania donovani]|uniref:Protein kinase domain family protein n=1 Tax=Leishmania donovani TaxID=5661 RepID=E9BC59_LEIDO|nr:serine/threonine-protein kinase, putative [Leishmania donovani]TPP47787.1 Protein kinase domain family protein [Leishmania donovani]CBZ32835.1 serine/threonine-protein kinase, putative [Leishmania donovani]
MADSSKVTLSRASPERLVHHHRARCAALEGETHAPYEVEAEPTQVDSSHRHYLHYGNAAHIGVHWHSSDAVHGGYSEPSAAGELTAESRETGAVNAAPAPTTSSSTSSPNSASTAARTRLSSSHLSPRTAGEGQPASLTHNPPAVHADPAARPAAPMASTGANGCGHPAVSASAEGRLNHVHATGEAGAPSSASSHSTGPPAPTAAPPKDASTTTAAKNHPLASATTHARTGFSNGRLPSHPEPAASTAAGTTRPPSHPQLPLSHPTTSSTAAAAAATFSSGAVAKEGGTNGAGASTSDGADPYARPAIALSVHLLGLYKMVNARYCAQRRLESPGPKYNSGYDDKDGHYLFLPGEVIFQRYIAQEVLGKGSFGTVIRGFDQKRSEAVAMKITRRGSSFRSQAKLELDILLRLNENPALNHLVVRLLKVFEWQGHLVLVFELLSFNLYQLIKCTRFNGVSLDLVRKFAYQLTHTLLQLELQKPHPIIHCDLKPENILLRNQNRSGIRLIDFGSACYTAKRFHRYIQSRFYRSPEVILFLDYGTPIDRWSLACVLVEMHTGVPLFDGRTEAAQLAKIEATLGPIPAGMVAGSPKANRFYYGNATSGFQLKEPIPERRTLESVIGVTTGGPRGRRLNTPGHDEKAYREFHDFISRFLRYQPEERMSCRDALQHPFLRPLYTSDLQQQKDREVAQPISAPQPPQKQQHTQCSQNSKPQPQSPKNINATTTKMLTSTERSRASALPPAE